MNLLYCGDSNIKDGLYLSIRSILEVEKGILNIYVLSMNYLDYKMIDREFIYSLDTLVKGVNPNSKVSLIDMSDVYKNNECKANKDTLFTPYCMLRLYADLVELPKKILYLDTDVLAYKSFKEFYEIDNSTYEVVGALDYYGSHIYKKNIFKRDYLNSGVLLLNLDLLKKNDILKKARELCASKKMLLPDQSALNILCKHKLIVDRKYNEQKSMQKDTVFRHFTTTFKFFPVIKTQKVKPWQIDRVHEILNCHEFDWLLREYKEWKMQNSKIIPVFFTIDDNFAPFLSVALKSLLDKASQEYFYNIHIVNNGLSEENKNKILSLETDYAKIMFNNMDERLRTITDKKGTRLREDYFSLAIFFRIFIPDCFKEYDKAIYIDSDTLVLDDISKLYNIDLGDNYIGGCTETSCLGMDDITNYFTNGVGVNYKEYMNSGMLVFDMKALREQHFAEKFLYLFKKYNFGNVDPDQSYINAILKNKKLLIDNRWNATVSKDNKLIDNPGIIHFNLFKKPWHYDNVAGEKYFWEYAKKTPYYEEIKSIKDNYTLEDKKKDDECLNSMIRRCREIVNDDVTFKSVFDSGKEERL